MDNFEDFEMRPLTSGLGFQKKAPNLKESVKRSGLASEKLSRNLPVAPPPQEMDQSAKTRGSDEILTEVRQALKPLNEVRFSATLPRPGEKLRAQEIEPETPRTPARDPLANISFQVPDQGLVDGQTTGTRRGASDAMIRPLVPISCSPASAFIDGLIVMALTMIFLAALVSVTGIEVASVMASARSDLAAQIALAVLALAVLQIYMILSRSFFGRTLGEWTFDVQLGEDSQIEKATYPLRVLSRSLLSVITGLVVLPLISLVMGSDLAGKLTGVRLYRQNY